MPETTTLRDWLYEWFETYAKPNIKESTAVSYECYIRLHIVPVIGNIAMNEIRLDTLQKFFNEKSKTLSPKTLSNIRMMLHSVFKCALLNDLISKNFVEYIKLPTVRPPDMRVFSVTEQKNLMSILQTTDERFAIGIFLCLTTGIRVGELCGLQWQHIDFEDKVMKIRQTVQRIPNLNYDGTNGKTHIVIGSPKSIASKRNIPLEDAIIIELLHHKNVMEKTYGKNITAPGEFVITHKCGTPVEPRTMQDVFKRLLSESHIADANYHALRHTFATRALEAGVDFKTLSILLGHSDINVTMNRYAHVLQEPKRQAMKSILSVILPQGIE